MEKWINNDGVFKFIDLKKDQYDKLPVGIYNIELSLGGWFLEKLYDKFEFNYKVYNFHQNYLDYITNYYNNTDGNLGILFNGLKGSGNKLLISLDKKYVDITEKIEVTKIKTNPSGKIIDSSDKGLMP